MRRAAAFLFAALSASRPWAAPANPPAPHEPPPAAPVEPKPPLLGFCAVPVKPDCVDAAGGYDSPRSRAACAKDMERYVKYVFAYRVCLNAEMERAVRQTNEAIARHKCRLAGGKKC